MKKIKNVFSMIKYNFKTLIGFELIYKLLTTIIFVPLFLSCFKLITKISGYSYLTLENIVSFLLNPLTLVLLFILILLMTFHTVLDISTVIIILNCSYQKIKITIREAFLLALQKAKRIFQRKNILLPFLVLFLIPFLNIGISSSFISTIAIPEFIMDFIKNNSLLFSLYIILMVILVFVLLRWLYAINYFILEDCDFKEARKRSVKLSKKTKIKDFLSIILTEFFITIIYFLFILLGIFLIVILYKLIGKNLFGNLSITIIWLLIALSFIVMILLGTPISYALISILFYKHKEEQNEKIVNLNINSKKSYQEKKFWKVLKYAVFALVILSGSLFTYSILNNKYDFKIEYVRTMEVTAHRGASAFYPENTMSAFQGAKELGANWIELDVQETKDKKIVVLHDTNLKRTTGVNKDVIDLTYDEIQKLDAGSFFAKEFQGEKIPLLEEVLDFANKNNINLNIELKPTGKEVDFEKLVVDLIKKYNFENNSVITSQTYAVLENVKNYDKNIKTVYVMSLAYGNILELKAADSFSIEASSITKTLVNKVHNTGKELYAWTVNTKDSINKMIDLNVDNIITDDITLALETIYSSKTSNLVNLYIKFVNDLLK